jgi:hypothetical protein
MVFTANCTVCCNTVFVKTKLNTISRHCNTMLVIIDCTLWCVLCINRHTFFWTGLAPPRSFSGRMAVIELWLDSELSLIELCMSVSVMNCAREWWTVTHGGVCISDELCACDELSLIVECVCEREELSLIEVCAWVMNCHSLWCVWQELSLIEVCAWVMNSVIELWVSDELLLINWLQWFSAELSLKVFVCVFVCMCEGIYYSVCTTELCDGILLCSCTPCHGGMAERRTVAMGSVRNYCSSD